MRDSWFTIEELDSETYCISEYGHWERTHQYLFVGRDRALLIDSGTGIRDISPVVASLTDRPVLLATTHWHWDHIGNHHRFDSFGVHRDDAGWVRDGLPLSPEILKKMLFASPCTLSIPAEFRWEEWVHYRGEPPLLLENQELLELGGRTILVIHTPGHSPGHLCFYEEERGYLVTGDCAYRGTIDLWYESTDPMSYFNSMRGLCALPHISRILPGHFDLDISVGLLRDIEDACYKLFQENKLRHGSGLHPYENFSLRL